MKLFNLAIASLVDANTGIGVNHRFIEQFAYTTSDYEQRARDIRAKTFKAAIAKVKNSFKRYIEVYRARAQEKEYTEAVLQMSDHLLRDIGLTHTDVHDLRSGQITLEALNTRRELHRIEAFGDLYGQSSGSVGEVLRNTESVNQEDYGSKKCA